MTAADADVDINNLLQIRQGFLSKLGGGQEKGHKWNRRWCAPFVPIGAVSPPLPASRPMSTVATPRRSPSSHVDAPTHLASFPQVRPP
jgi:hypothetical protein